MNLATDNPAMIWLLAILRGVGQIVFQGNALTGLLFLVALALGNPWIAIGGFVGSLVGTALMGVAGARDEGWRNGLHGFNPSLVGMAIPFRYEMTTMAWVALLAGAVAATGVTIALRRLPFGTYTTAFIVTTWGLFAAGPALGLEPHPPGPEHAHEHHTRLLLILEEALAGLSEIMLEGGVISGLLILAGIAASDWRHAMLAGAGTLTGTLVAHYCQYDEGAISLGIYGYNSALAAIAAHLWRPGIIPALLAATLAAVGTRAFPAGVPLATLTAPFVLTVWLVQALGTWADPLLSPRTGPTVKEGT